MSGTKIKVAVIGSGSAGLEVAKELARQKIKAIIVDTPEEADVVFNDSGSPFNYQRPLIKITPLKDSALPSLHPPKSGQELRRERRKAKRKK